MSFERSSFFREADGENGGKAMKPSDLNFDKAVQLLRDYLYYQQQQKKKKVKNEL